MPLWIIDLFHANIAVICVLFVQIILEIYLGKIAFLIQGSRFPQTRIYLYGHFFHQVFGDIVRSLRMLEPSPPIAPFRAELPNL